MVKRGVFDGSYEVNELCRLRFRFPTFCNRQNHVFLQELFPDRNIRDFTGLDFRNSVRQNMCNDVYLFCRRRQAIYVTLRSVIRTILQPFPLLQLGLNRRLMNVCCIRIYMNNSPDRL